MINLRRRDSDIPLPSDEGIIDIPIELVNDFLVNPLNSMRDYACIPTNAISPFFTALDLLDSCLKDYNPFNSDIKEFDRDFVCNDEFFRYIHADLAYTKDGLGIAMSHIPYWVYIDKPVETDKDTVEIMSIPQPFIVIDFSCRIVAEKGKQIKLSIVQDLIMELTERRGFYINLITFDRFESVQMIQNLRDLGFNAAHLSTDRTAHKVVVNYDKENNIDRVSTEKQYNSAFECVRTAVNESRISIPFHEDFYQETRGLEYLPEEDKVVKSPHSSDDLISAIAGSAYNASNNEFPDIVVKEDESTKDDHYKEFSGYGALDEYFPEQKFPYHNVGLY